MRHHKMCIRAVISGTVQGVFFRAGTQQKAQQLHLTGWVKNLMDGQVELIACGDQDSIMLLTEWLWKGTPNAKVSNVHWEEIPWQEFMEFNIEH